MELIIVSILCIILIAAWVFLPGRPAVASAPATESVAGVKAPTSA